MQRLYTQSPLKDGLSIAVDRAQANYLMNVLRLNTGSEILLFNGQDGEWLAEVMVQGRKSCSLNPIKCVREQTPVSTLHYLFAPIKAGRLDYMVQKAVEMGVGVLSPVITQHTQISGIKIERVRSNAIEAAEQCGILSIPEVKEPRKLTSAISHWDQSKILLYCDEHEEEANQQDALRSLDVGGVVIGPEGGFSTCERQFLKSLDFVVPISLGPRILRADTAAVAALTLIQSKRESW